MSRSTWLMLLAWLLGVGALFAVVFVPHGVPGLLIGVALVVAYNAGRSKERGR